LQLPYHRFGFVRRLNTQLMRWWIGGIVRRNRIQGPITWFTIPHVARLAGILDDAVTVYYCIDDYAALPGVDKTAVREMDRVLTSRADVVFVASETLLEEKRQINQHTYVSPHGVDVNHFGAALEVGEIPEDVACLERPIIGFFGLIEKWIDLDLIEYVATRRPDWEFVMIGRVAVEHHRVMSLPNVHFLGRRPYASLPDYGRAFDVAIIPYRLTQQVQNANPLKLREYLAMGKPIVSVRTPEIEKFSDVVGIADNSEQFMEGLDAVLEHDQSNSALIDARVSRVAESSWEARVASVLKIVQKHLDGDRESFASTPCVDQPSTAKLPSL
jgi:glycosyltransferase involved in cell wall biosynthesis